MKIIFLTNYREFPASYTEKLKELRYSKNTLDVYTDLFEEFINYYPDLAPENISEEEIIAFLRYLVNERKISTSYQNQSINAIKFYYERVFGQATQSLLYRTASEREIFAGSFKRRRSN
ncbi:MAG: phage integrase N-terminal SAM-like domain-containing protein, partial [Kaistella sp.]|nr:phage integrase N-terminal SAM-like domain-containing protein [Kaistella sp.]